MTECGHCADTDLSRTDSNPGMERAWIELEGVEAIVKTASKAKFFIEFHSSCLEGMELHQNSIFHFSYHWATRWYKSHSRLPLQRQDARVRMTHRAAMFPGFSNWVGPSNNCPRSEAQSVWKWPKITFL